MTPRGLWLIFACIGLLALPLTMPLATGLRWVGPRDLAARTVSGSLWGGQLQQARLGRIRLGEVTLGLEPLPLLIGRTWVRIEAGGGDAQAKGRLRISRNAPGADALSATVPLAALGLSGGWGGDVSLRDFSVDFRRGACREASGRVTATINGLGDGPVSLTGRPVCQGRSLVAALSGGANGATAGLTLRLEANGRYQIEAVVQTADPALGAILAADGFTTAPGGYRLTVEGRLG
jgi:general secretion pathway protein N